MESSDSVNVNMMTRNTVVITSIDEFPEAEFDEDINGQEEIELKLEVKDSVITPDVETEGGSLF